MTTAANTHSTLLVGTSRTLGELVCAMPLVDAGKLVGCVSLDDIAPPAARPMLGDAADLARIVERYHVTRAIVSIPTEQDTGITQGELRRLGVDVRSVTPIADQIAHTAPPAAVHLPGKPIDIASLIGRTPHPIDTDAVRNLIRGKRVLVTGAGGSIGSELASIAARYEPAQIILMERSENALFEIDRKLKEEQPTIERFAVLHDVVDAEGTKAHLRELKPDIVFHAAAHKHVPLMEDHPSHAVTNNLFGTKSIADAAIAASVERFVLISSDKAVNPSSVMGATKRLAERYIQGVQRKKNVTTKFSMVRFGNVLGSACSVLPIWASQLAQGRSITVTDERMTRFFMTIPEAAALVIQSAAIAHDGKRAPVFVLDMGRPIKIMELARRFCAAMGIRGEAPIILTGARPGEKLHEELAYDAEQLAETGMPGIHTWAGYLPDDFDLDALVEDLSAVRASRDREAVIEAIRTHVPEMAPRASVLAEFKSESTKPSGAAA